MYDIADLCYQSLHYKLPKQVMSNLKKCQYDDNDEDQLITQIKSIASQIFTTDFDQFISMDLNIRRNHQIGGKKTYSYTDRPIDIDRQDCFSEWITYENFDSKQITENPTKNKTDTINSMNIKNKPKNDRRVQLNSMSQKNRGDKKDESKVNNIKPKSSIIRQYDQLKISRDQQPKTKIKIQHLSQYGFMKPLQKSKKSILIETYKKAQQQQMVKFQKIKTLEQLYSQKEPLYQKFIRQRQKKAELISESRLTNEQKQAESLREKPIINTNIKVKGSFEQRLKNNTKKSQQNKAKVMNDVLKDTPFQPQMNNTKKYQNISSIIKKNWSENNIAPNDSIQFLQTNSFDEQDLKASRQNLVQTFSRKKQSSIRSPKKANDLKLGSSKQLCNILEIEGKLQQ